MDVGLPASFGAHGKGPDVDIAGTERSGSGWEEGSNSEKTLENP